MIAFREVRKGHLLNLITGESKKAIFHGQYKPGKRLPSEDELVNIHAVSKIVIRKAIRNSEHLGWHKSKEAQP